MIERLFAALQIWAFDVLKHCTYVIGNYLSWKLYELARAWCLAFALLGGFEVKKLSIALFEDFKASRAF